MWPKRISEVTRQDIEAIVAAGRQEGLEVEFKRALSGEKESEKSRRALAAEIVAFANAFGGTLVLGIAENGDHRAEGISAVIECRALAGRLASSIGDLIDPPIAGFECEGVPTAEDGSGVVVMRVPPSIVGPHWVKDGAGGVCYVRRNTSATPCSMREVQEMTLTAQNRRGRLEEITSRGFRDCEDHYELFEASKGEPARKAFSMDLVATPIASLRVQPPPMHAPLRHFQEITANRAERLIRLQQVEPQIRWRPMLRGRATATFDDYSSLLLQDHEDGTVVSGFSANFEPNSITYASSSPGNIFSAIPASWLTGVFACAMARAEMLRSAAGAAQAPYRIAVRIQARAFWALAFDAPHRTLSEAQRCRIPNKRPIDLPVHEITDYASFNAALNQFEADLRGITGNAPLADMKIHWPSVCDWP